MKKHVVKFLDFIKAFIQEFLLGQTKIDQELVKVASDYAMIKDMYNTVVWGSDDLTKVNKYDALGKISDFLIMVNEVRLETLELLSGSSEGNSRTHVNAMLFELSAIQEEVEFLLSRHGIVHNQVIEPPKHDGMIRYWRNMNQKHSVNASLLTLAIF